MDAMNCPICLDRGHYILSRDPDEEDLCGCDAGDRLRSPGEMNLKRLMHAFNEERTK